MTSIPQSSHEDGLIWIELTNGCNLTCSHCYSNSGPGTQSRDKLNQDDYQRVIFEASNLGFTRIQFIGGEPLLNKSLPAYIARAAGLGFREIELFSNLTFLPEPARAAIVEYKVNVSTSIYSADDGVHDRIVGKDGSLACTVRNAAMLASSSVPVRAAFVELEANAGHYPSVENFLKSKGIEWISYDRVREFGRSEGRDQSMSQLCGACAGNTACITAEGLVSPCIMSRAWPLGSVLESPLAGILSSESTRTTRFSIRDAVAERQAKHANCGPQGICGPTGYKDPCGPQGMCGPSGKHCGPDYCNPDKSMIHYTPVRIEKPQRQGINQFGDA